MTSSRLLVLPVLLLAGCGAIDWEAFFSNDVGIDASCAGDDTVTVDGRDLCEEFERTGTIECTVGYRVVLDGQKVCPK